MRGTRTRLRDDARKGTSSRCITQTRVLELDVLPKPPVLELDVLPRPPTLELDVLPTPPVLLESSKLKVPLVRASQTKLTLGVGIWM